VPTPSSTELPRISTPSPGDTALSSADPVQHEADREAALAPPTIAQLAGGDHQDRHDQQEQRDRRLHTLHGRVQILGDVADHHVHVRARETADEWASASGARNLRRDTAEPADPGFAVTELFAFHRPRLRRSRARRRSG
jgi:hypothetical protein